MKKAIISFGLFLLFLRMPVQGYVPFPDSSATWVNAYYTEIWFPPNPFPTRLLTGVANYCMDSRDTVINSISYSQIHYCDSTYKGGIRDAGGKVYFIPKDSVQEYLLYDFTVHSGDTISGVYIENSPTGASLNQFILNANAVDSILINGSYRKRIQVEGSLWIEGIGNTQGLFLEPWINVSGYVLELNCMSQNNQTLYPALAAGACSLTLGIKQVENELTDWTIYPNPSDRNFTMQWNEHPGSAELSVFDVFGKTVQAAIGFTNNKMEINLEHHPAGIYLLRIYSDEKIFTKKLILN